MTADGGNSYYRLTSSPQGSWRAIDTDATGQYVWAVVATSDSASEVYMSSDFGDTWTGKVGHNIPGEYFSDIAVSDDHLRVVISAVGFESMITLNGGGVLFSMASAGVNLGHIDISGDGATVAATSGGRVYQYDIVGDSWTDAMVTMSAALSSISVSSNGLRITVSSHQGVDADVWRSSDGGMSYAGSGFASEFSTTSQAVTANMSADGMTILVGQYGGPLHLSRDGGATWTLPQNLDGNWLAFALSNDGLAGLLSVEGNNPSLWLSTALAPVISDISVNNVEVGWSGITMVTGNYFVNGCEVEIDGVAVPTTYVNMTTLLATVSVDLDSGAHDVGVNCNGLVGTSSTDFVVFAPTTTTVATTTVATTTPNTLVVTGTHVNSHTGLALLMMCIGATLSILMVRTRRVN